MTDASSRQLLPQPVRRVARGARRRARPLIEAMMSARAWRGRPPCVVGIPMMNLHEATAQVLADLDFGEFDELVIYDHGSDDPATIRWLAEIERHPKVSVDRRRPIPDESLYRSWNDTIRRALSRSSNRRIDVVLLNNDLRLPPGFIRFLARALRAGDSRTVIAYPDISADLASGLPHTIHLTATKGLAGDGGLTGWAFAVRAEAFRADLPYIDERLRFYAGDRDLIFNVEARGLHAARVDGLPCLHDLGLTRKRRPELREQMRRDVELCWSKWRGQMREVNLSLRERRSITKYERPPSGEGSA